MRKLLIFALAFAATTLAGAELARLAEAAVLPGPPFPATELFPVEPGINAERGFAVAVDGDWLAMGAPREDHVADSGGETKEAGAVYLFHWSGTTWDQEAKLFADLPRPNAQLGFALAMRDGVLAAGAPGEGAVYIFAEDDGVWRQEKRLAGTAHGARTFGRSLALDGDRLAVGAFGVHGATDGAVYLYGSDSWDLEEMVQPRVKQAGERFGSAVSLAGSLLVVGAPGYDIATSPPVDDAGAVCVFQRGPVRWREKAKLLPPDTPSRAGQQFGSAVATDGTEIFAGAPTADLEGAINTGAVYRFASGDGVWDPRDLPDLEGIDPEDQLGASLALSADLLVAGAPAPPPGTGTGKIHIFRRKDASWFTVDLPLAVNAEARDLAGFAVAADGGRAIVAGILGDQGAGAAGAAWSFHCPDDQACDEEAEAVARDPLSASFGVSVALTKDFMAVGAQEDSEIPMGAVYLYRRAGNGWRQEERLTSAYAGDGFGSSVALEGSLLAVGAPQARTTAVSGSFIDYPHGSVDLFVRRGSSWAFETTLTPRANVEAFPAVAFGTSVVIADGVVAVGAPGSNEVNLFEKTTLGWTEVHLFVGFGSVVSMRNGVLAIGAPGAAEGAGGAFVAVREEGRWTGPQDLTAQLPGGSLGGAGGAALGSSVAVGDEIIAIGVPGFRGQDGQASLFGAVFLFEREGSSWTKTAQLSAFAPRRFGSSVALLGNRLVVGAPGQGETDPDDLDRAAVFERGGDGVWRQVADLDAVQPPHGDEFGSAVALSEDFFVVTSPGSARGDRVTVFELPHPQGEHQ